MQIAEAAHAELTYCLNVHPGDTPERMWEGVFVHAPNVYTRFAEKTGATGPYGLGLWLSASVAEELERDSRLAGFAEELDRAGLYALTLNGFPYDKFHGTAVKTNVYRPDWADPERLAYTERLGRILSALLPSHIERASVSTVPVTYRAWATEERVEAAVRQLAQATLALHRLKEATGKHIILALEPEPDCLLDACEETVAFFKERLFPVAEEVVCQASGNALTADRSQEILRAHLGVCLDTVHCGVLFEDPLAVLQTYTAAGIQVAKVQLGAALVANAAEGPPGGLDAFVDEVYLHQTAVRRSDGLGAVERFADLPEALASLSAGQEKECRVHFHVPRTWEGGGKLGSTRDGVSGEFLHAAHHAGVEQFEVEVYTLEVLPGAKGKEYDILAEELAWIMKIWEGNTDA